MRLFAGQPTRGGRIYSKPETHNHWVHSCNFYFLIIYSESSFECSSETRDRLKRCWRRLAVDSTAVFVLSFFVLSWARRGERQANENVGDLPEIGGVQIQERALVLLQLLLGR